MVMSLRDAQARLQGAGLYVSAQDDESLFIAGSINEVGNGINLSQDACTLFREHGRWVVVFPAEGSATREAEGSLPDLVALIEDVYHRYRKTGGPLKDSAAAAVEGWNPERPSADQPNDEWNGAGGTTIAVEKGPEYPTEDRSRT